VKKYLTSILKKYKKKKKNATKNMIITAGFKARLL